MASRQSVVDHIVAQAAAAGFVSARKMFGEYGLYCRGVMVALVCDDRLLVKPTDAGAGIVGAVEMQPPYPGAKPCFVIDEERWDDAAWLRRLFAATADALPPPVAKTSRTKKAAKAVKAKGVR